MKRALVTGHLGFVGKYFVKRLTQDGWDIVGVDIKEGKDCRDRKSTRLNSSHSQQSRMPSSA